MLVNGTLMQYFHWYYGDNDSDPALWERVRREAKNLSNMGITALWLPPPYKAAGGAKDVGYGIYDLYDLGEFDQKGSVPTKYGTKAKYLEAIVEAHQQNMQVYADVVFNHKAGADRKEWVKSAVISKNDTNFTYESDVWIEAWTAFDFPGRKNAYSDFKWTYRHFDGVDWAENLGAQDRAVIYKFLSEGKDWEKMVSGEHGNYDYLMFSDLDMNHPEVRTELSRWAEWFLAVTSVDGFRMDAVKHIQFSFFRDFLGALRRYHKKQLFAVGEYWSPNLNELLFYLHKTDYSMSLFDAPLQNNVYNASRSPGGSYDMRRILEHSLVSHQPNFSVTLVDNHDTQPCQALEHWVDFWFKPLAYALILLRKDGYPCVFYPDLYGAKYQDKGANINLSPVPGLEKMIRTRYHYAYGTQRDYFDHPNTIGWTREGDEQHPQGLAVLMTNGAGGSKWMEVGRRHAGKTFVDYVENVSSQVIINHDGWGEFKVNGGSVSVWVGVP